MKNIVILGCTGSIGTQTLDIVAAFPDKFRLTGVSARGSNPAALIAIAKKHRPKCMVVTDPEVAVQIQSSIQATGVTLYSGADFQCQLAAGDLVNADIVVSALSGTAGLVPTMAAIDNGLDIALANKETLVTGGQFVMDSVERSGAKLLPVDSEHSAIYQCLQHVHSEDLHRIILTCSGGPFSRKPELDLDTITPEDALAHPTWNMGRKITIDSATLMNKGLEIIEACWLFDTPQDRVDVVIHPQSIIHSMVETKDGSVMAQLSQPDMRHPILYALSESRHWKCELPRIDFTRLGSISFAAPDETRFPCLNLARQAMNAGGTATAVLNTANEQAVDAFCRNKIRFTDIPRIIEDAMEAHEVVTIDSLEIIKETESWTERYLRETWNI